MEETHALKDLLVPVAGAAFAAALWYVYTTLAPPKTGAPQNQAEGQEYNDGYPFGTETTLKDISPLWTTPEHEVIKFADVAKIWRSPEVKEEEQVFAPSYIRPEIAAFWTRHIAPRDGYSLEKYLINDILTILDRQGDCPSVVDSSPNDPNTAYKKSGSFSVLAQVPLWEHTLRVAEGIIRLAPHPTLIFHYMIAALGHDIAKVPSFINAPQYAKADHYTIAEHILRQLPHFEAYALHPEIISAVKEHHMPNPAHDLTKKLIEADQAARAHELRAHDQMIQSTTDNTGATSQQDPNLTRFVPAAIPPPQWFSEPKFKKAMKDMMNVVNGTNWKSFAADDGVVWYRVDAVKEAGRVASERNPEYLAAEGNNQAITQMLYSIFLACDCIDQEKIGGKGRITTKCVIIAPDGTPQKKEQHLVPVKVSWLGMSATQALSARPNELTRLIGQITPANKSKKPRE